MEKMISIARYRNTPYSVNYNMNNGSVKSYQWSGSTSNKHDIKPVPEEVVNWLLMNSVTFRDGELVIVEDTDDAKEAVSNIGDIEEYQNNTNSREEIVKLLKGNVNKLKAELKKITVDSEKRFILDVAREEKIDSVSVLKALSEWAEIPQDVLFADEE